MFARFKLTLDKKLYWALLEILNHYHESGNSLFNQHKKLVRKSLEAYLSTDGTLDAEKIEKGWFPQIPAHVFFSHSHLDERVAINLAGFLYDSYGIVSFVDSAVWGYANHLLKQIDEKYCKNDDNLYNYDMRNQSTAHVHMLLQGALAKMIDISECIIFLNTPNSLNVQDIKNKEKTSSPWIYNELLMASTFPPRNASRYGIPWRMSVRDSLQEHTQIPISYPAKLKRFCDLQFTDIISAGNKAKEKTPREVLNQLYLIKGLII